MFSIRKQLISLPNAVVVALLIIGLAGCAAGPEPDAAAPRGAYSVVPPAEGPGSSPSEILGPEVWAELGIRAMSSAYFDRAMAYRDTQFRAVSFSRLLDRYDPGRKADAVLLNCFDDYQGIVSVEDVYRYDLQLAIEIELVPGARRPDWLHPLLILVPDGSDAPFQERFMTANIRELRFVDLKTYYGPLKEFGKTSAKAGKGFEVFRDNCLFCHALKGVGGNKGGSLIDRFDFSSPGGRVMFEQAFKAMHHAGNPDKQNVEQFVSESGLDALSEFLEAVN